MKTEETLRLIATVERIELICKYPQKTNLEGLCIESSDEIVAMLKGMGFDDVEVVEGWFLYDDCYDTYTDRPYEEHCWVVVHDDCDWYVDVTATEFNPCVYDKNKFNDIIVSQTLPHGFCMEEPIEYLEVE